MVKVLEQVRQECGIGIVDVSIWVGVLKGRACDALTKWTSFYLCLVGISSSQPGDIEGLDRARSTRVVWTIQSNGFWMAYVDYDWTHVDRIEMNASKARTFRIL